MKPKTLPLVCNPCILDGKSRPAHGFCDTCQEHLCLACFQSHRVPSIMRDHVMLDQTLMPKQIVQPRDPLLEKCEKHCRIKEFYCKEHKAILCSVCVTLNYVNCSAIFIPDESKDIGNSREFIRFRNNVSDLIDRVKKNKENIVRSNADIEKLRDDTRLQVQRMKETIVRFFDTLEVSLLQEIDQIVDQDFSRMKEVSLSYEKIEDNLNELANDLDDKLNRKQINKLFVAMKNAEKKMVDILSEVETKEEKIGVTRYWIEPEVEMEHMQSKVKALGQLRIRRHHGKLNAEYKRDINVRCKSDEYICCVSGLVVLPRGRLVVCDCGNNRSVKLIDLKRNKVVSQIRFPLTPRDIVFVTRDLTREPSTHDLIVTLPNASKLQYVRVAENQITSLDKAIPVNGECYGIQITKERKLVVSYNGEPGKIEVLELDGHVLMSFQKDHSGIPFSCDPDYLAVSPCSGRIYVSDWRNKTLTTLSAHDGSVMSVLKGLRKPRGVAVDRAGTVFLCCCLSRTVHVVAATGDMSTVILGEGNGLFEDPRGIVISPDDRRMYVSGCWSDHVQEFKLSVIEN